jgi:hypothetical protein
MAIILIQLTEILENITKEAKLGFQLDAIVRLKIVQKIFQAK